MRVGLVGCVKSKRTSAAPARDLYTSALFRGRAACAERTCDCWFVLSAKFGVLKPDEIVAPYEETLKGKSRAAQEHWAVGVVDRLADELGGLGGIAFEIHAGAEYRNHGLVSGLRSAGASVEIPVLGLSLGQQLAYYARSRANKPSPFVRLVDKSRTVSVSELASSGWDLDQPGLYAWWVDAAGARDLSAGLGHKIAAGLIYAGQTGAGTSTATLRQRVTRNHARGNIRGSTLRWTLAASLREVLLLEPTGYRQMTRDSESRLTDWIAGHLKVSVLPMSDRIALASTERKMLQTLDPPLNLEGTAPTTLRRTLSAKRSAWSATPRAVRLPAPGRPFPQPTAPRAARTAASTSAFDARSILLGLRGKTIHTLTGRPNRILQVGIRDVVVATDRSPGGQPVPIAQVQAALDVLIRDGEVRIDVDTVGHRSALIGAVLATLPGASTGVNPRVVRLGLDTRPFD